MPKSSMSDYLKRIPTILIDTLTLFVTLPYFRIYKRNTGDPLNAITKETDNAMLEVMIDDWIKSKRHEFEYTSVAGAVIFASVPTCLQFADIKVVHWTAPAFWYASILLAVTSVVLAAQQTMVLSGLQKTQYLLVRDRLKKTRSAEPRWTMLHIWQIPIQCLSYSLLCFLIGLFSYVFSPLTQGSIWSGNAQIAIVFGIVVVFVAFNFVWSSAFVYYIDT